MSYSRFGDKIRRDFSHSLSILHAVMQFPGERGGLTTSQCYRRLSLCFKMATAITVDRMTSSLRISGCFAAEPERDSPLCVKDAERSRGLSRVLILRCMH